MADSTAAVILMAIIVIGMAGVPALLLLLDYLFGRNTLQTVETAWGTWTVRDKDSECI